MWTVDLHFTISCVDFTLGQPPSAWFMPWLTKSALIVFTWWQKTYMFSPDLKKSKILGWFHLIFWSNSSTLDNAWHRILGHVLAFGGQMCFSLCFFYEIRKKLILKIRKAECLTPELLIRPDFFHDPSWNLISWNTAAALRDLPCWSLNCTGRLIFLENIWSTSQTFKCETG